MNYPSHNPEPLCGWPWHDQHRRDHTQAEIDSLSIEVRVNDKLQVRVEAGQKKHISMVKEIVRVNR